MLLRYDGFFPSVTGPLIKSNQAYKKIDSITDNLNFLITDIKLHPKKYVRFSVFLNACVILFQKTA